MNSPLPFDQSPQGEPVRRSPQANLFKEVLAKVLKNWYWFLISVAVCLVVSKVYLRYMIPMYNVQARFLLKSQTQAMSGANDELTQMNIVNNNNNDVANEMEVLRTRLLMMRTVRALQLNVAYFQKGLFKSTEVYRTAPFIVELSNQADSAQGHGWTVTFSPDGQKIFLENETGKQVLGWGDTLRTADLSLVFLRNPIARGSLPTSPYLVTIAPEDAVVSSLSSRLKVMQMGDNENVIQMSLADAIPRRGEDVLNKLYEVYTLANVEDQSTIADKTIEFINNRLEIVHRELSGVEKNIEEFKTANHLVSLDDQSKMALQDANDLNKQVAAQDLQLAIIGTVEERLQDKTPRVIPPDIMSADPSYFAMLQRYDGLIMQRDVALQTTKPSNPLVVQMDNQIDSVKRNLVQSLANVKRGVQIAKEQLTGKLDEVTGMLHDAPSKERAFLDISREQTVKQQLYLFLLQKREETAISKSGTLSNSRLIEPARCDGGPFSPNRMNFYAIALVVGLVIPAGIIYLKEFLNNKVWERKDIETLTATPILAEIGHNKTGEAIVVAKDARSSIAEQFRSLRTNLRFVLTGKQHQVILVTSSMSGEGKSFVSLNLAATVALSGKKVALLELDLRKPRLSSLLGLNNDQGFSSFMVSNMDLKYLPKQVPDNPNLYVIGSGPIPPNPAELLLQDKMKTLFDYLYANFDYIVIDTPPVGLVSDALLIAGYADTCLYVTRQNYTFKQQLSIVDDLFVHRKMKGLSIIINDVDVSSRYGYGYGYGYRYGGAYYEDDWTGKSRWARLFMKNRKNAS
ncbi:MAG TPA: polysaccharide biosynthesis tyrosine autokinase [Dinghuibacter sp.]|uniref:GumC family protein n=1 Tax=Dinghuibacter sp. TaxID=2024697 RepID=UPI002BE9757E|nr:polysaccharide biosynthesis tyrosine autokinase [Dinghuibacter sp.]HTJ12461.1 polysaccharide biosynthesis tyrosine autokinase [Dinghuibacter sp.]